jgi:lipoyl-dependent peroxiredoxin
VEQAMADVLVQEANAVCPYSNATKGNIQVTITAVVK